MKIGLLGSAPSSLALAPYKDPSWTLWGCSPGVYGIAPRTEAWFEMHLWEPGQPWFSPEYCAFVRDYPGTVYMSAPCPEVKNCTVYPIDEMEELFGPYFWTSSVAYMMALAITKGPEEIGLWGIDMAATEEYGYQRAGCQYMAMVASIRGIKITAPPQSDLFVPPPKYGFIEQSHMYLTARARMIELNGRKQACEQTGAIESTRDRVPAGRDRRPHVRGQHLAGACGGARPGRGAFPDAASEPGRAGRRGGSRVGDSSTEQGQR